MFYLDAPGTTIVNAILLSFRTHPSIPDPLPSCLDGDFRSDKVPGFGACLDDARYKDVWYLLTVLFPVLAILGTTSLVISN